LRWTHQELKIFFESNAKYLSENIKSGKHYDGLIVVISCHGMEHHIVTSNQNLYSRLAIFRTFAWFPVLREIPRFFLFDCCSGGDARVEVAANEDASKGVEVANIFDGARAKDWWVGQDFNPNHRLARVDAANEGFVSKLNLDTGSYVVHQFYEKYCDALANHSKPTPFISEMFTAIQDDLQAAGKQLPEAVWNADTKYLVFGKNKNTKKKIVNDVDMLESELGNGNEDEQKYDLSDEDIDQYKSNKKVEIVYEDDGMIEMQNTKSLNDQMEGGAPQTTIQNDAISASQHVDALMVELADMNEPENENDIAFNVNPQIDDCSHHGPQTSTQL